ncbi:MAG: AraC family ligand binding domain-containing protein [Candidatus Methylopumilus sp.]|nr:AraC family ligand binding domain-containing protein [Candidatus Methylopumilus sp.]
MNTLNFDHFKKQSLDAGFDEVLERTWAADTVVPTHTHPFSVQAIVTQGEMWMTCHGETKHLTAGGTFEMKQNEPHSERYGAEGATFWVARKHAV